MTTNVQTAKYTLDPPPPEGENAAAQPPKLKLAKPVAAVPIAPPPPPAPGAIPPPPSVGAAPAPAPARAPIAPPPAAPRPAPVNSRKVGGVLATLDLVAMAISIAGAVILYVELFVKTKG